MRTPGAGACTLTSSGSRGIICCFSDKIQNGLINLHYSQTYTVLLSPPFPFYLPTNLHYSQTVAPSLPVPVLVLLTYKFTLFSNIQSDHDIIGTVLLTYKFTLFSNTSRRVWPQNRFYLPTNLHYSQTV